MRIIEILKSCSNPIMGAGLFYSGPKWLQNVQADKVVLPCVFMDQPIDFKFIRDSKYAQIKEQYQPIILFCDKSQPEFTQEQHNEIIETRRLIANQFVTNLISHPEIFEVYEVALHDVFNFLDQNLTGVVLQFQVKLKAEDGICPQEPFYYSNPVINSLTGNSIYQGRSQDVTVYGSGFLVNAFTYFEINGELITINSVTMISDTEARINVTVDILALPGTRSLTIINSDGIRFTLPDSINILI
jgi:hypothetical protein